MSGHDTDLIAVRDIGRDPLTPPQAQLPPGAVGPGRRVTLNFSLSLPDGEEIDSNFGREPVTCTIGDGSLLPGFEAVLFGMVAGQRARFELEPEQAFGAVNEDNIQRFPVYRFPPDLRLERGLMVDFADAAGNNQAGVIVAEDARHVEVDFNHPLAGRRICFSVQIHQGADATGDPQ